MADIYDIIWSNKVQKQLDKLSSNIQLKFFAWVTTVSIAGILTTRKSKGLHDEPLKGKRKGQRSVRLNRSYRAIYILTEKNELELIEVIEVNKHEY